MLDILHSSFLIPCILLLLIAGSCGCVYWLKWRDYSLLYRLRNHRGNTDTTPRISIIIPVHNQAHNLRNLIPAIYEQIYPDFEVIVVDEASTDETHALLDTYSQQYPRFRHTFIPFSASHNERRKLAITLGVKTARSSWCLLTCAEALPVSPHWLQSYAQNFDDTTDLILGYTIFPHTETAPTTSQSIIHQQLLLTLRRLRTAPRGVAHADSRNLCFRRDSFLKSEGFTTCSGVPFSEGELLAACLSRPGNTKAIAHRDICLQLPLEAGKISNKTFKRFKQSWRFWGPHYRRQLVRQTWAILFETLLFVLIFLYAAQRIYFMTQNPIYSVSHAFMDMTVCGLFACALFIPRFWWRRSYLVAYPPSPNSVINKK